MDGPLSLVGVFHQQAVRLTKQEEFGPQNFAGEEHPAKDEDFSVAH
jgi:hypothetical protein